jgi:DNA-binding response OmpR family regulator
MVVEKDENILEAFKDFFKKEGYQMVGVTSPQEALKILKQRKIDLLIVDFDLDEFSGSLLLKKRNKIYPHIPLIVMTGLPERTQKRDLRALGVDYIFQKPLEIESIRMGFRAILGKKSPD